MKKSFFILSIFVVIIALFSSCSKSDEANPTPEVLNPNIEPFIKYTYNNVEYQHTPETLNSLKKTILGYSGINDALKKITLIIPLTPAVGAHNITYGPSNVDSYSANFQSGSDLAFDGTLGSLNITVSNSSVIEGTFQFSGLVNGVTYNVTGGSFKASK